MQGEGVWGGLRKIKETRGRIREEKTREGRKRQEPPGAPMGPGERMQEESRKEASEAIRKIGETKEHGGIGGREITWKVLTRRRNRVQALAWDPRKQANMWQQPKDICFGLSHSVIPAACPSAPDSLDSLVGKSIHPERTFSVHLWTLTGSMAPLPREGQPPFFLHQ